MDRKDFRSRFHDVAAGVPDDDLDALIAALDVRALVQGDVLVHEGDEAHRAWLIFDGTLGVTLSVAGDTVSLGRVGPGTMVGEVSFIDGGPASATLTAQTPVTALELSSRGIGALVKTHPRAAAAIHRAACEALALHLRAATDRLMTLRTGMPGQMTLEDVEGESLLDALRELFGMGRR